MGDNSYRNYAGPSQEYSPGDIDPVSNHVVVDVNDYGNITVRDPGPGGALTGSAVAQFGRYAESGNLTGYYGYLESYGSGYGEIGYGYHTDDQSWSGYLSDQYST